MTKYNVLQAIFMSFYSKKLYRDVATTWGGKSFLYLLLLLALSWIVFTYQAQVAIKQGYGTFSAQYVTQIPVLTITKGILSTPENRPYLIKDPDSNKTVAIIDTSGKYINLDQTEAGILVTQSQVITKQKNETKITNISDKFTAILAPLIINDFVKGFVGYLWILIFIAAWIASYVYRLFQAFLYSIIGKIFSAIFSVGLSYGQILQIELVSITPVIILATILSAFNLYFAHQLLAYFLLGICYLFYGIVANKK